MKANDLMLGDLVTFKDCQNDDKPIIVKIWQINANGDALAFIDGAAALDEISIDDEVVGIPLTPEILEKNGWNTTDRYRYNRGDVWFGIINRGAEDFDIEVSAYDGGFAYVATIYNVHELQHALRLFGIDKEIEL